MLSELLDLLSQLIEVEAGQVRLNFDRRTLHNIAAQFRALFV